MRLYHNYKRGLITSITLIIITLFVTNVQGEGDIEEGRKKARACQVCHGQGGKSNNPTYPRLAGQHAKYIIKQLKAFKSGTRKDPIMNGMASTLSLDDMEDVAAFFESNGSDIESANVAAK
ncbi:c-type cytochrome [Kaarinaea lacus]